MITRFRTTVRRGDGSSAVEYGLLVAAIAAIVVGIIFLVGRQLGSASSTTDHCIQGSGGTTCSAP